MPINLGTDMPTIAPEIGEKALEIIAKHSRKADGNKVTLTELKEDYFLYTTLDGELDYDSLEKLELAMALEEQFNAEVPEDEFSEINTIGGVLKVIAKYRQSVLYDIRSHNN